ncbi:4Fe-4S dicluster domain-containing protein [Anaeromyxobacter terrae]|uniref:4Fe-4S dicluster domain-containing protein n=1 Tax=Anaeromyxobacter terrae TaxID=2925406 RepID=UPI001F58FEB3|nr:4Fe-4S dicluster domain-containing protein [Anaeromyxobacter sp. SG22]
MSGARKPGPTEATPETEQRATGVYLCRCGPNLGEVVRLGPLADPAAWPGAGDVAIHDVLCSEEGKAWLAARIRERGLERVVVGACSPREHEATFRAVLAEAGRSPEHLQLVNLREQVEWVGGDPGVATERARRLLSAGLARVRLHRPIPREEVAASPDVLVVGGGAAGVAAARAIARRDRRVFLVERAFALGGLANRLDEIFPAGECASCFMEPVLDEVLHSERIEVLTGAELRRVRGAHGRFAVELAISPRGVDPAVCLGCGACSAACPALRADPDGGPARKAIGVPYPGALPHASAIDRVACLRTRGEACDACARACPFGAVRLDEPGRTRELTVGAIVVATGMRPGEVAGPDGVVSTYALERMLHPDGPTGGELRGVGGRPPRAVLLAATADEDGTLPAEELLKLAGRLRARLPSARVAVAGGIERAPGGARRAAALAAGGVELLPGALVPGALEASADGVRARLSDGAIWTADLVAVHAPARAADGAAALARLLRIDADARGFLADRGASPFEPTATRFAGIYVAGAAAGPRPIHEAIRDGAAAAGLVLASLAPGDLLPLEPLAAEIDQARCGGCAVCVAACPFGAVALDPATGRALVAAVHCRGCGTCVAACPAGAATARHFTGAQIAAEISALLRGAPESGG